MSVLPNLSASFRKRYLIQDLQPQEGGVIYRTPMVDEALFAQQELLYRPLSNVGKVDDAGYVYTSAFRKLPRMDVVAAMLAQYQGQVPIGTMGFPYSMKANGFVDARQIWNHQGVLVSNNLTLVP